MLSSLSSRSLRLRNPLMIPCSRDVSSRYLCLFLQILFAGTDTLADFRSYLNGRTFSVSTEHEVVAEEATVEVAEEDMGTALTVLVEGSFTILTL